MAPTTLISIYTWITSNGPTLLSALLSILGGLSVVSRYLGQIPALSKLDQADQKLLAAIESPVHWLASILPQPPQK